MTPLADAGTRSPRQATEWQRPGWLRVAVIAVVLVAAFLFVRPCQESQVRVTKEQAIDTAKERVDFKPELTQIRLLRQGLSSKPFWIVVLSTPTREGAGTFKDVAQVHVNANTGEVEKVTEGEPSRQARQSENQR